jgi:hypothetical protein
VRSLIGKCCSGVRYAQGQRSGYMNGKDGDGPQKLGTIKKVNQYRRSPDVALLHDEISQRRTHFSSTSVCSSYRISSSHKHMPRLFSSPRLNNLYFWPPGTPICWVYAASDLRSFDLELILPKSESKNVFSFLTTSPFLLRFPLVDEFVRTVNIRTLSMSNI